VRTCIVCGRTSDQTTVVVDHRDPYQAPDGSDVPARDVEFCLADYKAKTGKDWDGPLPED
jgi:hypothetical protein